MDNNKNSTEQATLSIGEQFRQAREKLNLSFEDIAKQISLRPSILQQIESDLFIHKSIPATFMKGYVRSYAKLLKLPDELWENADFGDVQKNDLDKNARSTRAVNQYSSHSRWVGRLSLLVAFILAAMTGLWWWENYQKSNAERENLVQAYNENYSVNENITTEKLYENQSVVQTLPLQTNSASAVNLSTPVDLPVVVALPSAVVLVEQNTNNKTKPLEQTLAVLDIISPQVSENTNNENRSNEQEKTEVATFPTDTPTTLQSAVILEGNLQIEVLGDCWISVKDRTGKVLAQREYKQGQVLNFSESEPYDLIIGAPNAVKITYKGEPYPLKVDGRIAKFRLE